MKKMNVTLYDVLLVLSAIFGVIVPAMFKQPLQSILQTGLIAAIVIYIIYFYKKQKTKACELKDSFAEELATQKRLNDSYNTMLDLNNAMLEVNSLDELLYIILEKATKVMPGAKFGSILVMNDNKMLEYRALFGFDNKLLNVKLNSKETFQWNVTKGCFVKPLLINNIADYSKRYMLEENFKYLEYYNALNLKSTLSAPILIEGCYYGSINIDSTEEDAFTNIDVDLMEYFAKQASNAIKNHELYEKKIYLSKYDGLTNVYNRHYFEEIFDELLAGSLLGSKIVSLVLMDLNKFKEINDQYGHTNGDKILKYFTSKFGRLIRKSDMVARYGGDEFIAVFYDCNYENTKYKLEDIHKQIVNEPLRLDNIEEEINCEFCYGIAEFPKEGLNYKTLIDLADKRLYEHKASLDR